MVSRERKDDAKRKKKKKNMELANQNIPKDPKKILKNKEKGRNSCHPDNPLFFLRLKSNSHAKADDTNITDSPRNSLLSSIFASSNIWKELISEGREKIIAKTL